MNVTFAYEYQKVEKYQWKGHLKYLPCEEYYHLVLKDMVFTHVNFLIQLNSEVHLAFILKLDEILLSKVRHSTI